MNAVEELTYRSYRYNRRRSPQVTPAQWARVFGVGADALERRYQSEVGVPVVGTNTPGSLTSGDDK